jgi:hypothetical protein
MTLMLRKADADGIFARTRTVTSPMSDQIESDFLRGAHLCDPQERLPMVEYL